MDERGGEVEAALHAAGVGADGSVEGVADVDERAELLEPGGHVAAAEPVEAALEPEQLGAGLLRVEGGVLEGDADAQAHLVGLAWRRRTRRRWPCRRRG